MHLAESIYNNYGNQMNVVNQNLAKLCMNYKKIYVAALDYYFPYQDLRPSIRM